MEAAREGAQRVDRKQPNIEDQVRAISELIGGLRILAGTTDAGDGDTEPVPNAATALREWNSALDATLTGLLKKLLSTERGIAAAVDAAKDHAPGQVRRLLGGFLLPFASRTATRERTHIFTTNYDRLIERGCDLLGLPVVDRFVGALAPVFHSSRLASGRLSLRRSCDPGGPLPAQACHRQDHLAHGGLAESKNAAQNRRQPASGRAAEDAAGNEEPA